LLETTKSAVPVEVFLAGDVCALELIINEEATNKSETTSARALKKRSRKVFILFFSPVKKLPAQKLYHAEDQDGFFDKHCTAVSSPPAT
jgi:hypothetical protein